MGACSYNNFWIRECGYCCFYIILRLFQRADAVVSTTVSYMLIQIPLVFKRFWHLGVQIIWLFAMSSASHCEDTINFFLHWILCSLLVLASCPPNPWISRVKCSLNKHIWFFAGFFVAVLGTCSGSSGPHSGVCLPTSRGQRFCLLFIYICFMRECRYCGCLFSKAGWQPQNAV